MKVRNPVSGHAGAKMRSSVCPALKLLAAGGALALAAISCGGGEGPPPSGTPTPSAAVAEGPDFVVQGVDPATLCFDLDALPSGFVLDGEGARDNESAAQLAPDPRQREQEYQTWGRISGYYRQWAFSPPSELKKEEASRLSKEEADAAEERARQEILAAPFSGATCTVDLYTNAQGAREAFAALASDVKNPPVPAGTKVDVDEGAGPGIGSESRAFAQRFQGINVFVVIFVMRNVVAQASVVAPTENDAAGSAEELARALGELLHTRLQVE